jgi:SAM-dependent methyltransferase
VNLSLLSPLALLAAAAVAIPVAIHLLQRRREATVDFPAIRFLLIAQRRAARHLRVRRLLLLLVRCLALLVFALLLARPVLRAPAAAFRAGEPGWTAVILDTSLSMSALAGDDRPRFAAARELARRVAGQGGERERFALLPAALAPRGAAAPARWLDADGFGRALDASATLPVVADPARAFAEAYRLLREAGAGQRRILVISDCARGGWDRASLAALPAFDPAVPVRVLRLGGDGASNRAGVLRVRARGESRVAGEPREIAAELFNAGPGSVVPVELWVDGALAASRLETVRPGTAADAVFTLRPAAPGPHAVEVRLPGDRYPADDRRRIGVDVLPPVDVLVVDGEPGASLAQSETFFLREALRPERLSAAAPVRVVPAGSEAPAVPIDAPEAVVVLANVRAPSEASARVLARHVSAGGSLLVFWGAGCDAEAWQRTLGGILPAPVTGTELADPGRPWRIDRVDFGAPPLAPFAPPAGGTFATAAFTLRARLGAPSPAARVLASFADGAPWLVEQQIGRGRVLFAASTADLEGNDLATRPVFMPLVQRLTLWLAGRLGAAEDAELVVGDDLRLAGPAALAGSKATLVAPGGAASEIEYRADAAGSVAVAPALDEPGIYRWSRAGAGGAVGVNVPAAESDLTPLGDAELAARLLPVRAEVVDVTPSGAAGSPASLGVRPLTLPLLFALLALLLLEMLVAGTAFRRWRPGGGAPAEAD